MGKDEYLTDRLNLEAVEFVERNQDKPFFLYLSHYAPHTILNGRPDLVTKYLKKHPPGVSERKNCYLCQDAGLDPTACTHWSPSHNPHLAAMLESIDDGIGLLAGKLAELGLAENTIFLFSSDNGGETNVTSNAPLRGGKSQLYEGGIRVPLITLAKWKSPGRASLLDTRGQPRLLPHPPRSNRHQTRSLANLGRGFHPCYLEKPECRSQAQSPSLALPTRQASFPRRGFRRRHTRRGLEIDRVLRPGKTGEVRTIRLEKGPLGEKRPGVIGTQTGERTPSQIGRLA